MPPYINENMHVRTARHTDILDTALVRCNSNMFQTYSLKQSHVVLPDVATWGQPQPSYQPCSQVTEDVSIQIIHDKNIKLWWVSDQLQHKTAFSNVHRVTSPLATHMEEKITAINYNALTLRQAVSKYISLWVMSGYCSAISLQQARNRPSDLLLYNKKRRNDKVTHAKL